MQHTADSARDARHDFDFIFGKWHIANRRLRDQLDPRCSDWVEFPSVSDTRPIFDGLAHIELIDAGPDVPNGPWQGLTLRQFDPVTSVWRIWWASSRRPGHIDPPLEGRFINGVGQFEGDDEVGGRRLKVRFEWVDLGGQSARWTQSFSFDGGASWVPNWVMEFQRRG